MKVKISTERKAEEYFEIWAKKKRGKVNRVARAGVGYDYEVRWLNGKKEKFEVKGSKKLYAIPDMSIREFDQKTKKLKADFLFVVNNIYNGRLVHFKIPRDAITGKHLFLKQSYHIRRFGNQREMNQF